MKKDERRHLGLEAYVTSDPDLRAARAFLNRQVEMLDAARQRFYGGSAKEAAKWVLDLVQRPVEEVRARWEVQWSVEITAFAQIKGGAQDASVIDMRELEAGHIIPVLESLRHGLVLLSQGQRSPAFKVTLEFNFAIDWESRGSFNVEDSTAGIIEGFLWGIRKVLRETRRDIQICARPECGVWFVKSTAGQYHSTGCSQMVRTAKWLNKKRDAEKMPPAKTKAPTKPGKGPRRK